MGLRVVSWNVNGIRALFRKGLFIPFVASLDPAVICLQETRGEVTAEDLGIEGFFEAWNPAAKKGYSGTAILSKIPPVGVEFNLPSKVARRNNVLPDAFGDPNAEGRVITAEFESFFLVNVYTPNSKGDLSRLALRYESWDRAFLAHLRSLQKRKPVVFCGDLNVAHTPDDLARPKQNEAKNGFTAEEREGFDNFLGAGFVDTFRLFHQGNGFYTWWTQRANARANNVGWRIDYVLVSSELRSAVKAAEIHPEIMGSDHCPVSADLDF